MMMDVVRLMTLVAGVTAVVAEPVVTMPPVATSVPGTMPSVIVTGVPGA